MSDLPSGPELQNLTIQWFNDVSKLSGRVQTHVLADDAETALCKAKALDLAVRDATTRLVRCAREQGLSWARIGTQLGMSRQAAWERFGHYCD